MFCNTILTIRLHKVILHYTEELKSFICDVWLFSVKSLKYFPAKLDNTSVIFIILYVSFKFMLEFLTQ